MLGELDVLVIDCQAAGATPAHGDLLELGWAICGKNGLVGAPQARWIRPRTMRGVSRTVRELTGFTDACVADAVDADAAWAELRSAAIVAAVPAPDSLDGASGEPSVPTVIHFARFELPFLRELHGRAPDHDAPFPLATVCLHAIATRIFPDLPRRNLRALAGHLGHSAELVRRSAGHVDATAFIWRALVPLLEERGVSTWSEIGHWLDAPAPKPRARGDKRVFPLAMERRRALPDAPGVYRFLRPNGDVLYVGKAASLKKRVASHFAGGPRTERALEMLSQAHDVRITVVASALEAALLETDEIKRIDPPYNVHLRAKDRHAWFASRDWLSAANAPDEAHVVGPLPSPGALSGIAAVRALLEQGDATDALRAAALGVPLQFAPSAALFGETWRAFALEHLGGSNSARARVVLAARRIVVSEEDAEAEADASPALWDGPRIRRHLERTVFQEGRLVRRAHALALLAEASVLFREPGARVTRILVLAGGDVVEQRDLDGAGLGDRPRDRPPSRRARQSGFDAARYDRLRVLSTELRRVVDQGGDVTVRLGRHVARVRAKGPPP